MANTKNIPSKITFGIENEEQIDQIMNSYSDEDFIQYVGLDEDYTRTELAEKMRDIINNLSSGDRPNLLLIIKLFRRINQRLVKRLDDMEDTESEEEETTITVPKAPKVIKKRHTIVINSDKRLDRTQPTTSFSWELDQEISNVKNLSIESYNIPKNWYNVDSSVGNNIFAIEYVQPMKIYFTTTPEQIDTKFANKSPSNFTFPENTADSAYSNWFNENIVTEDIGSGMIRNSLGRNFTDFPNTWKDKTWYFTSSGTGKEDFTLSFNNTDDEGNNMSVTSSNYDISYMPINDGTFNFLLIRETNSSITIQNFKENNEKNLYFLIKRDMIDDIYNSISNNGSYTYKSTTITTIGELIATFLNSRTPANYNGDNIDPRANAERTSESLQDYEDLLLRFHNIDKYVPPNHKKKSDFDLWSSFKYVDFNDGDEFTITTNLLKREARELLYDISTVQWEVKEQGPSNIFKFYYTSYVTGSPSTTTMNKNTLKGYHTLPEEEANYYISGKHIDSSSIEITITPKSTEWINKMTRRIYFRMPDGHYGTVSRFLSKLNSMTPKTYYDDWLSSNNGPIEIKSIIIDTWVDSKDLKDAGTFTKKSHELIKDAYDNDYGTSFFNTIDWNFVRDSATDKISLTTLTEGVKLIFYDIEIEKVLNGDVGCGSSQTQVTQISSLDIEQIRNDAFAIAKANALNSGKNEEQANIEGTDAAQQAEIEAVANQAKENRGGNKIFFSKKNTMGRMLGYYDTTDTETFLLESINIGGTGNASKQPDLRRVKYVNIVLIDYKSYAYLVNANQSNPGNKEGRVETPKYYSEVEFEKICDSDTGEINLRPVYTKRNTRQLTENQIYSLNEILQTQEKIVEKTSNYLYTDYILYGLGIRDKPEPGNTANDGVLQTYDSKKGKRAYTEPTRLTKFHIELVDQDYNLIKLNGVDIEFTFNIETETKLDT